MPRQRRATRGAKASATRRSTARSARPSVTGGEFVCPECGRAFTRAAALGAHRSRAHGVAGKSAQAKRGQTTRGSSSAANTRAVGAGRTRRSASTGIAAAAAPSSTRDEDGVIDRDALLKVVFPAGVPPREEVIRAATGWLDEADRLARMR